MVALNPRLFPRPIWSTQGPIDDHAFDSLYPAEQALVAKAVESRRLEFATGRIFARELLRELGYADAPLLADSQRAPQWPTGAAGSIAHTRGWCAVAVAPTTEIVALGIDVEATLELEDDLWQQALTPEEHNALAGSLALQRHEARQIAMQLFCAKEALFKAQYPLTGSWLSFDGAAIDLAGDGSFTIDIREPEVRRALAPFALSGAVEVTERITAAVTLVRR